MARYFKNAEKQVAVIKHLRDLGSASIVPEYLVQGICKELYTHCSIANVVQFVNSYAQDWKYYTGDDMFPVPHSEDSPCRGYMDTPDLWDADTTYGWHRLHLCRFIADCLEQELTDEYTT